ncbi:MAG: transposase [Thermoleophilia bacterium]
MRDVESLCEKAGLGRISKSAASRVCRELRDRFAAFKARDLSGIRLVTLFLDAIYLPVRPSGAKEGGCSAPGAWPRRASACCSRSRSGCASRKRTGSHSGGI